MDIQSLIFNRLPGGLDKIISSTGVEKKDVEKIMKVGVPEIVKEGQKSEGDLFDNLSETVLTKTIADKTGLGEEMVQKVISFVLPLIRENIDSAEMMKIIGGLSDGFGIDDLKNIAEAVFNNDDNKKESKGDEKKSGMLKKILGSFWGKK